MIVFSFFKSQVSTDIYVADVFFMLAAVAVLIAVVGLGFVDSGLSKSKNVLDNWVQKIVALYDEPEILRARDVTTRAKPANVKAYFEAQFRRIIPAELAIAAASESREETRAVRSLPMDDPYGF